MKALHPSNISDLLFNIPIYQRLFTWGIKQIKELLDDLLIESLLSDCLSDYHIGVLTVRHSMSSNRIDLVDGQQRFTLMMLMGCAMKEYHKEWENCFLKCNDELRLDFYARDDDRKYLNSLIDGNKSVDSINETMECGFKYISKYLKEETFSSHCEKFSNILKLVKKQISVADFCKYVYEHLSFFLAYLPDDYNARMLNKHFESMNSTGRNLENHEILKVQLLRNVSEKEYNYCVSWWNQASRMEQTICQLSDPNKCKEHIEIIYNVRKREFITDQMKENKAESHNDHTPRPDPPKIIELLRKNSITSTQSINNNNSDNESTFRPFLNFTDYILQVLYTMLGEDKKANIVYQQFFNPNKLIETCSKYVGKEEGKIKPYDFIETIYRYRFFFDYYIIRIDGNGSYRLLSSESSEHDKLEQYEAMLYADSSRYTYYRWIPFILKHVSDPNNELCNDKILEKLKKWDSFEIEEHKNNDSIEFFSYGNFNNYYFRRLDYYLWEFFIDNKYKDCLSKVLPNGITEIEDNGVRAIKDYRFHQFNSVEHFHPRSETEQIDVWNDDNAINSFGNLALISQSFNSTQNDDSLSFKFVRVKDQIDKNKLESIKLALIYYSANKEYKQWTKELMKKHGDLMFDFLKDSYKEL